MSDITFCFPRWLFPNNLGDSMVATFVPSLLRQHTKQKITVITDDSLGELFKLDTENVENVIKPRMYQNIKYDLYPAWHRNVFSFWGEHHSYFSNHPSINIITVNYCLLLGLENYLFTDFDFRPKLNITKSQNTKFTVAIAPVTKLSGKSVPHPNCDGLGYRFNGNNGLESWRLLVERLREKLPDIKIVEFSPEDLQLGDYHVGMKNTLVELVDEASKVDFAILTDGGYHHLFNALHTKLVLFNGSKISKYEFARLGNAYCPDHLHLQCRFNCPSYFVETQGVNDFSKTCKLECEQMDPIKLADFSIEKIKLWM